MRHHQRNRIVVRCVVAAIWLLGFVAATSTETVQVLYLLPILALLSFFLVDYFSGFVIALLLTVVAKMLYLDQVPGTTRALIIDAIWIAAIVAASIKLLQPSTTNVVDQPISGQPISDQTTDSSSVTANYQMGQLPAKFWHDLQTPVRVILGLCQAILRGDHIHGQAIPALHRENVQAIYRNAQQMEKMIADFKQRQKPFNMPDAEELDPAVLIQEAATLIQDLMTANGITFKIKIGDSLPKLRLDRITMRQVLLTVLRTIARANNPMEGESLLTVRATVQHSALHITVTALSTKIQSAVADANWSLNECLLERIGGRVLLESVAEPPPRGYSTVVLSFPVSASPPAAHVRPSGTRSAERQTVLVITDESNVIEFFEEHLGQHQVIGIKDINALNLSPAPVQALAVILTREQHYAHRQLISDKVGKHTPIIACTIATAQERLHQLKAVYLSKPVDSDALFAILTNVKQPIVNILIVDDISDSAEMLSRMLAAMSPNFVSWTVGLAKEALMLLEKHPIDAIILDVFLPDMVGIALVQEIRSRERFAYLPIVLVSAQQNLDSIMPAIDSNTISLFQSGGCETMNFATYIEALVNAAAAAAT